jgi:hypothetical protein
VRGAGRPRRRARAADRVVGPAADLLAIAPDRVDLAVVGDRAEWLREPPRRLRVRRVALVEERVREADWPSEVRVQLGKAATGDEALVNDRATRCRRDRQVVEPRGASCGLEASAGDDEATFEIGVRDRTTGGVDRPVDDNVPDVRAGGSRRGPERARIHRHASPRNDAQPLARERLGDDRPGSRRSTAPARQEGNDDSGPLSARAGNNGFQEGRLQWKRDTRPIARLTIGPERAAMAERRQAAQRKGQHPLEVAATGVRDEPDPARIVFELRVVERSVRRASVLRHARLRGGEATARERGDPGGRIGGVRAGVPDSCYAW